MVICVQIYCSKFTQKTNTGKHCPSPLCTISLSIAIGNGAETQSGDKSIIVHGTGDNMAPRQGKVISQTTQYMQISNGHDRSISMTLAWFSGIVYAGVMSHDPPQIQTLEKCTFKQGNGIKSVCVCSVHCISCTINTVSG